LVVEREGRIAACNGGAERLLGVSAAALVGQRLEETGCRILREDGSRFTREGPPDLAALASGEAVAGTSVQLERPDGGKLWISVCARPLPASLGEPPGVVVAFTDVTEQRRLVDQLVQAQKMEVLGRLTSGIAHDFNNLLTAILGYGDFLLRDLPAPDPRRRLGEQIQTAAHRGVALTAQLLGFARRRPAAPQSVSLDAAVQGLRDLLGRLLGDAIGLRLATAAPGARVWIDTSQLEQVVLNLVINARDAMTRAGEIVVRTREEGSGRRRRAVLEVVDSGVGMDAATLASIFEPFFTTKGPGKGTGLGLTIVDTIVRRAGGEVAVTSEPGRGTVVRIRLPVVEEGTAAPTVVAD
jgi:PAS domain S-box-containing protein